MKKFPFLWLLHILCFGMQELVYAIELVMIVFATTHIFNIVGPPPFQKIESLWGFEIFC